DAALRRWIDRTEGAAETPPPAPSPTSPIPRAPAGMPEPPGPGARAEPRPSTIGATAAAPAIDLPAFARRLPAAAERTTTGHFGDNKVFISHVWRTLRSDPDLNGMSMEDFKRRLGEANNARLLDLSRADLVQAMDPQDIRESEVAYYGATYHFVRL